MSSHSDIILLKGTSLAKNVPVIILRESTHDVPFSVLAEIDGYYISDILSKAQSFPPVYFRVGGQVLSVDNRVREMPRSSGKEWHTILFPQSSFEINYMISDSVRIAYFWRECRLGILCCVLLAFLVFFAITRVEPSHTGPQFLLENALARSEFVPYIQPIVSADTRKVTGGEILLRWDHPVEGIILPDRFISLAESTGLIVDITCHLLRLIKEELAPAVQSGYLPKGFHLGVNISPQHLNDKMLPQQCASFLANFPEDSLILVLEITERENSTHDNKLSVFDELKKTGVKFALDDFGTGYSTYTWLQQFPVDYLKIDKSFVQKVGTDKISGEIVEHVVTLSQQLNIKTVAEGVENESQSRYLIDLGVEFLQGYAFGRPVPLEDFIKAIINDARK
ncbi:TPA: EAL domain-containing protein [Salmonella enterica]